MTLLKRFFRESDLILYLAFIWQIPFSWRYILVENRGNIDGPFNEYMDVSVYVGEIFILVAILIYILKNENIIKSIYKKYTASKFHVEQLIFLVSIIFIGLNAALSVDPILSLTFIGHAIPSLAFIFLTYTYVVSRGTLFLLDLFKVLIISLAIQFIITLCQIIHQSSIGLYFLNESKIQLQAINVAKSEIFNSKTIRGYGTFLHPNILAGYCLAIYSYFLFVRNLFHVKQSFIFRVTPVIIFATILLSQSKVGILTFFTILFLSCSSKLFHVKQKLVFFILILILSIVIAFIYRNDIQKSVETRLNQFQQQSNKDFDINIITGSGLGTYRYSYEGISITHEWWLLEPVHNVPYIVYRESGLVGLMILLVLIAHFVKKVSRETLLRVLIPLFAVFVLLNTDHYLWDIQQGTSIFLLLLISIIISIDKINKKLYLNNTKYN